MGLTKLGDIACGDVFHAFGDTFVKLALVRDGVLAIRETNHKHVMFDANARNNLAVADILEDLNAYVCDLASHGMDATAYVTQSIDLRTQSGLRDYGRHECTAGLLTLSQYLKYRHLIPVTWWQRDRWSWWLATPAIVRPKDGVTKHVWSVLACGDTDVDYCGFMLALRPTMNFTPNLLVTVTPKLSKETHDD